ncbi:uncharacterized protein [Choristoneura fumiferana]|uniref:uncharacterized protein n=1 Tax=Choristoneura fumiferana TaxID=7141 RepID=UPI003D157B29
MVGKFNALVLELFDKHAPVKTIVVKEALKPWLTSNLHCSRHFTEDSFVPNDNKKWRRLKSDAVPTLNIPSETSSFVVGTLSLTETNQSLAEPTTSRQCQDRMEPFTEINTGNKIPINLRRKFSSTELGTSTEEAEMDIASAKKNGNVREKS